ncbi:hypothetical protein VTL71DRAFT_9976 [Oculimacula yallundae]|uniref:SGNH hydrolase-type esterase domain-containing protein n=1 Tax=Oculimacula yallundae TaxID=86028 RepID=A0ABR4BSY0_9HELO
MQKLLSPGSLLLSGLAYLSTTLATPLIQPENFSERLVQSHFGFASIGDSWAAGQAVISKDAYGGPDQWTHCYRHAGAWEALMAGDNTWTDDPISFKFAACSGAHLHDATTGSNSQIQQAGRPYLLTMQLGGNDAHFGEILTKCIYVGDITGQRDYPDPNGGCFKVITTWETYLDAAASEGATKSFYFDHHDQLRAILATDLIKGRDDFYLYTVGYTEFFNVKSPDSDWCNDQSFGIIKAPKLSKALRTKLNALSVKVNSIIEKSTSDLANDHFRFYNPSSLFENHRFCEPGHNLNNQYFLNDVWFWNMSPPEDDPQYAILQDTDLLETAWAQNYTFMNGTQATQGQLLNIISPTGNPYDSWSGRSFHPKTLGHVAIKDGLIQYLRDSKVPGVKAAPRPSPPLSTQPYASGQVHIHINEYWDCHDNWNNLFVDIDIWDTAGTLIGHLDRTQAGASASARMGSKLEDQLVVTPEWARRVYSISARGSRIQHGPQCFITDPNGNPIPVIGAYSGSGSGFD